MKGSLIPPSNAQSISDGFLCGVEFCVRYILAMGLSEVTKDTDQAMSEFYICFV